MLRNDTTKVSKLLGWAPTITFEAGVRHMMEHIDYWRDAPVWTPQTIATATNDWFKYLGQPQ